MTCKPAGNLTFEPIETLGATPEEGNGANVPVNADMAHIPKHIHNKLLTHPNLRSHSGLFGAALTISFVNVIVRARIPVESVISCCAKACAAEIPSLAISKLELCIHHLNKRDTMGIIPRSSESIYVYSDIELAEQAQCA